MSHENLVGLNVTDEASYQRYRDEMTPILARYGGRFRHDFRIAETLRSEAPGKITRLFIISFPDTATKVRFFADPEYVAIRARHFVGAVDGVSILAEFDTTAK